MRLLGAVALFAAAGVVVFTLPFAGANVVPAARLAEFSLGMVAVVGSLVAVACWLLFSRR